MSETKSIKSDLDNSKKKFDVGSWLIPIIAVFVALFIGGLLIKLQGLDPIVAYRSLFKSAFGSVEGIGVTLAKATPLVLAGLAVAVGLRAGLFNIGAQGQLLSGALAAAWAGVTFDASGKPSAFDFEAQVRGVLRNVEAVLQHESLNRSHIIDVQVFLTNMSDQFPVLNKVWNEFFSDVSNPPVRTTVAVKELPGLNLVEMKVIATTELAK